jgi:hypothetical protein
MEKFRSNLFNVCGTEFSQSLQVCKEVELLYCLYIMTNILNLYIFQKCQLILLFVVENYESKKVDRIAKRK